MTDAHSELSKSGTINLGSLGLGSKRDEYVENIDDTRAFATPRNEELSRRRKQEEKSGGGEDSVDSGKFMPKPAKQKISNKRGRESDLGKGLGLGKTFLK